jgi:hypothetical protein
VKRRRFHGSFHFQSRTDTYAKKFTLLPTLPLALAGLETLEPAASISVFDGKWWRLGLCAASACRPCWLAALTLAEEIAGMAMTILTGTDASRG